MTGVSIQQIEIFLAVAGSDSISAAARGLYMSQPVVSGSMRGMEEALGYKLFSRNSRGVSLTERGARLYAELDPVYNRFRIASGKILERGANPSLNLGAFHDPSTIRAMLLSRDAFRDKHPQFGAQTEYYNHSELREKLLTGELDAAFTFAHEVADVPDLDSVSVGAAERFFIVPTAYGMTETASDFTPLRDKTLILEVSSAREMPLELCRAHGFEPRRVRYVDSYLLITHMLAAGEGFTVGGRSLPGKEDFKSRVTAIPIAAPTANERERGDTCRIVAAWLHGGERNGERNEARKGLRDFLEILKQPETFAGEPENAAPAPDSKWYR
ncbi:MAG: LysR family transcriptional regulator [Oscillospiraceae bacterium]|jgi:DNA-binding transcriptional LysR family regulator|nr:LysR family transcriptional regulator [Oscillospiraceae bacterium]